MVADKTINRKLSRVAKYVPTTGYSQSSEKLDENTQIKFEF